MRAARGQDRMTESNTSEYDVLTRSMFGIGGCEEVTSSIFLRRDTKSASAK